LKRIVIVCSILLLNASLAAAKFDPAFTWTTLETPHFLIHFHQGEEEIAKRTAVIAEDLHARLVPRIKWEPRGRTHLVLVDAMDETNGLTTSQPYNQITLFITPPSGGPGFGTISSDEWIRTLLAHEYTHVLHLDMINGGLGGLMQSIFGRLYFPNQLEPLWMIEGLATYEETEQSSGGRGRSPGAEMIIRMAALEDRFPQLSQATVFPNFWPAGDVPYLFGEGFTRYLVQKYGRETLADLSVTYSGRAFPLLVDSTGERVLKQTYSALWDEWQNELKARYSKMRDELTVQGLTVSLPITRRGYMNVSPAFSPDGKRIAYLVMNEDEFPGIYMMNADGTDDRKLIENSTSSTSSGESIAWSPEGRGIYYTKMDVQRNTNLYNDIYYYDIERNREVRITRGLRARDPFPSPDGKMLLFVANELGKTRLGVVAIPQEITEPLRETDVAWLTEASTYQYDAPRFGPDGTMIVVGVWQSGGYRDIWILDNRGNKIEELMHDRAVDSNATWSPDGEFIYFSSDRSGIFNLYAYERTTKKIYQITNVLGGAFTPAPSPDGKVLVFSSYSSRGYDLHLRSLDTASWRPEEPYFDRYPVMSYNERPVEKKVGPYNPLPTLVPRFWLPWFGYSTESGTLGGFLTFAQDAVERHSYVVTGLYSPSTYRTWYAMNYVYDGLYPSLKVAASDIDGTYSGLLSDPMGTGDYVEREKTLSASIIIPLLKIQSQHALTIGYRREEVSALTQIPPSYSGVMPAEGTLASGRVSYQFNSAKQYGFSISPEDGRTIELGYEHFDKSLGSDFNLSKYTADWHEYDNFPWKHHVLLVRAFAGASQGDVIPQGAYQLGGDNPGDSTIPVDGESIYLRGYPVNAFRGSKAALASLEYRFPIKEIELGWSSAPVFFRRFHGAVFAEAGNAWDDTFHSDDLKRSIGAEIRLDTDLVYQFPITLRLVITKGLDERGESKVYLSLWMPQLF
jgi:Tol biopolymer transport system component